MEDIEKLLSDPVNCWTIILLAYMGWGTGGKSLEELLERRDETTGCSCCCCDKDDYLYFHPDSELVCQGCGRVFSGDTYGMEGKHCSECGGVYQFVIRTPKEKETLRANYGLTPWLPGMQPFDSFFKRG